MPDSASSAVKVIGIQQADRKYIERSAVRLVLRNDKNAVVLIWSEKGQYFKLPGGGVESNEDHLLAGAREAMEETGCKVRVAKECVATCEEWRNDLHQWSYCYLAQLEEDTGNVQLTQDEVQDGLQHRWCGVDEALRKCRNASPTTELGRFIQERDTFFLETVMKVERPDP